MIDRFLSELCSTDYHGDWLRNIVSLRESQDLFDDLSDQPGDWHIAIAAELAAKPLDFGDTPIINRPFEQARYCAAIRYPFENWTRSRYSDGNFGVWYGADSLETSIFETTHHWLQFLHDADFQQQPKTIIGERRIFQVQCNGLLFDFRPKLADYPQLATAGEYGLSQQIGRRLHHEGHPGLITHSAHCKGDIGVIFTPQILSNPRDHCYLDYRYNPDSREIVIIRKPDKTFVTLKIQNNGSLRTVGKTKVAPVNTA